MDDPIQGHPTRGEQLDILAALVAGHAEAGDAVLDLGCGTGYVAHLIAQKRAGLRYTGVDLKPESLAAAAANLEALPIDVAFMQADLEQPETIVGADGPFKFVITALTFHDLSDAQKQAVLAWATARLAPGGCLLIYDRLRLTSAALYPLQRGLWQRIEQLHGRGMRAPDDFAAYVADLGPKNQPAALTDYLDWLATLGLDVQPLHLHGNVALIAAARPL